MINQVSLSTVVDFVMGQAPHSSTYNNIGNGTLFVRVGDFGPKYPNSSTFTTKPLVLGKEGDVFLCVVGATCGKVNMGINAAITRSVAALRPKKNIIIQEYLYYFFLLSYLKINSSSEGSAQPILNKSKLSSIQFPLTQITEQKHIVAKIDTLFAKIDKAISLTEESLKQAKNLLPSVLKEVFEKGKADGWEEKKLEEVIEKTKNVNPKTSSFDEFTYIDISAVDKSLQEIVLPKTVKSIDAPSRAKKSIKFDDILFATTRPNLKNIAIVSELYDFPIASTGFCVVRSNSEAHNRYLFYYLISDLLQEQIKPFIRGAQYPAISDKDLKSVLIPVPNLKEQIQVSALFDKISDESKETQSKLERKLAYLKQLKSSILSKAFKGEL